MISSYVMDINGYWYMYMQESLIKEPWQDMLHVHVEVLTC